jgi:hypothetical protein
MEFVYIVVASVLGAAVGYGFRGLINRDGKKVEAAVKADVKADVAKVESKL